VANARTSSAVRPPSTRHPRHPESTQTAQPVTHQDIIAPGSAPHSRRDRHPSSLVDAPDTDQTNVDRIVP
jgi:hypothetical protein